MTSLHAASGERLAEMNPFDLKTILLAKHAQHVVLIHFPIALFLLGVGFDVVAQWTKNLVTAGAARYNLVAAAIFTPPVLLTGLLAWRLALGGPRLKGILLLHLVIGCTAGLMIMAVGWLHLRSRHAAKPLPVYRLPLELLAAVLVGLTAHLGGFLSGVNVSG
jgi:uncharacterized membrane protein